MCCACDGGQTPRDDALPGEPEVPEEPEVPGDPRPDDFVAWVEWFTIPTDSGPCRIEATVDTADPVNNFFIYYLIGNCGGTSTMQFNIS